MSPLIMLIIGVAIMYYVALNFSFQTSSLIGYEQQ